MDFAIVEKSLPRSYPPALKKACVDSFHFVMKLRGIDHLLFFTDAEEVNEDWVHVTLDELSRVEAHKRGLNFERGVDVRVSEIQWVVDAPFGS